MKTLTVLLALTCLLSALPAVGQTAPAGQERVDSEVYWKIRREATDNSQILRTTHFLTDVYGPRLTGSPNHKSAAEWVVRQAGSWGLENAKLEPWDFGRPGWLNERLSAHIVSPVRDQLTCEALAWTPGTNGAVTGKAFHLILPERPTRDQLNTYFDGIKNQVRGAIVLVGRHQSLPVTFNPPFKRRDEQEARSQYDPNNPAAAVPPFAATPAPTRTPAAGPQVSPPPQPPPTPAQVG
ncbi:MAG: M20/M25/M40 family metallo-hydrolase, partial [Pyrinomonadaceae bacterium]